MASDYCAPTPRCAHPTQGHSYDIRLNETVCLCGARRRAFPGAEWRRAVDAIDQRPAAEALGPRAQRRLLLRRRSA